MKYVVLNILAITKLPKCKQFQLLIINICALNWRAASCDRWNSVDNILRVYLVMFLKNKIYKNSIYFAKLRDYIMETFDTSMILLKIITFFF